MIRSTDIIPIYTGMLFDYEYCLHDWFRRNKFLPDMICALCFADKEMYINRQRTMAQFHLILYKHIAQYWIWFELLFISAFHQLCCFSAFEDMWLSQQSVFERVLSCLSFWRKRWYEHFHKHPQEYTRNHSFWRMSCIRKWRYSCFIYLNG